MREYVFTVRTGDADLEVMQARARVPETGVPAVAAALAHAATSSGLSPEGHTTVSVRDGVGEWVGRWVPYRGWTVAR